MPFIFPCRIRGKKRALKFFGEKKKKSIQLDHLMSHGEIGQMRDSEKNILKIIIIKKKKKMMTMKFR